jgi:hypothetical protein
MKFNQTSISTTIDSGQTSVTLNFKLNNTGITDYTGITWTGNTSTGVWSLPTLTTLNVGENTALSATLSSIPSTYTGTITASIAAIASGGSPNDVLQVTINVVPISCAYNNTYGNLRIKKIEFTNNGFSGSEFGSDDEWFPIDDITVEITVENNGNEKIEDVELEWGLYDPSADRWIIDFDDEDKFDIKSDKEEVVTVEFTLDDADVDLEDMDEGTYELYVRATGFDNEYDQDICDLESEEAEIIIESDFVVLNEISVPETVSCGTDFLVSANVWNVGGEDQEGVYVNIYNKELKIDKNVDIGDVDAFSSEKLDTNIVIPSNAADKTYGFVFSVYDENDDIYENDYDGDESSFTVPVKLVCTGGTSGTDGTVPKTVVSASLESGGKAGAALVVKSTITNLENKAITYTINPVGYSGWADSAKVDQSTFVLGAGESKSVSITFDVKDDAQGEKFFDIEVVSGNEVVTTQPVSVTIEKKGFSMAQLGEGNYIWAIAIINIILVVAIILVAVRAIRK